MQEKPPLSSALLLAEISEKITEVKETVAHVASASSMGAAQMTRAVRILDSGHQLSARDRNALEAATDKAHRVAVRLEAVAERLSPRPASMTVVAEASKEEEDWSLVNIKLPGAKKMIAVPNRVLWAMASGAAGTIVGWLGHMILKWASR